MLSGPTWRANPDWAQKLGYDAAALDAINKDSITFLEDLRAAWEASCDSSQMPCVINGVIGPRGDGYKAGIMDADEAEAYHNAQIASFVDSEADMVSAFTLTHVDEAIGIVRAAERQKIPCAISFTVETNGRLPRGETLQQAIETVDHETNGAAEYFMINCAHPSHFEQALDSRAGWTKRIYGIRANASTRSHAELDESETLDDGDPQDLGLRYRRLRTAFPAMRIIGGCCGGPAATLDEFRNGDQVVGDQVEHEIGATRQMTRCFVLRIVPCCLPQPKMHSIIARRDCGMP